MPHPQPPMAHRALIKRAAIAAPRRRHWRGAVPSLQPPRQPLPCPLNRANERAWVIPLSGQSVPHMQAMDGAMFAVNAASYRLI